MQYEFKSSFDRRFKKLSPKGQRKAYLAIDLLLKHIDEQTAPPTGLGLKNWHGDYWEIRADIKDRVLFEFTDQITFLFAGNHYEIKRFMKSR